jgi:hypothetical protein
LQYEEEEWDLNKKYYLEELRWSNFEKRLLIVFITLASVGLWIWMGTENTQIIKA